MYAIQKEANRRLVVLDGRIFTCHIGMPDLLAMIAERRVAVWSHTIELWTIGTAAGDDGIVAIGGWTPTSVSDCD